jgi:hypothetical protein
VKGPLDGTSTHKIDHEKYHGLLKDHEKYYGLLKGLQIIIEMK